MCSWVCVWGRRCECGGQKTAVTASPSFLPSRCSSLHTAGSRGLSSLHLSPSRRSTGVAGTYSHQTLSRTGDPNSGPCASLAQVLCPLSRRPSPLCVSLKLCVKDEVSKDEGISICPSEHLGVTHTSHNGKGPKPRQKQTHP